MHELALTEDILAAALAAAQQARARAIRQLHLILSSASHIEPETVRTHFALISRGTAAEGAELVFRTRAVEQVCRQCGVRFVVRDDHACPACGTPAMLEHQDAELVLDSIDVDVPAETP
jgi:hydrogenase nickel incorporation protein HypA/HybF